MIALLFILRHFGQRRESGQAMIFFAVVGMTVFLTFGLAVEGGRLFVEYRKMQAAADVAALVGAERLPCVPGGTCVSAVQDACNYVQKNGFGAGYSSGTGNCAGDSVSTPAVYAPPKACSPYDFIDYGNNATDSSCNKLNSNRYTAANSQPNYIEVQISEPVTVPIFNIGFNLYVHAVARQNFPGNRDYAIAVLDPTACQALNISGSGGGAAPGVVVVGPVISLSTATNCQGNAGPNSIYTGGNSTPLVCEGQWLTTADESPPPPDGPSNGPAANLTSVNLGSGNPAVAGFAPPDCLDPTTGLSATRDAHVAFQSGVPPISDPYGASGLPGAQGWSGCSQCNSNGYVYTWSDDAHRQAGTWYNSDGSLVSGTGSSLLKSGQLDLTKASGPYYELFPGTYPDGIKVDNGSVVFFNPGVYTVEATNGSGGVAFNGGNTNGQSYACIYGAPVCDRTGAYGNGTDSIPGVTGSNTTCPSFGFGQPVDTTKSATWYYYCSPWGFWDTNPCLGYTGSSTCTPTNGVCPSSAGCNRPTSLATAPTFVGGSGTHPPLNGVTFYITQGDNTSGGVSLNGGEQFLAFPNACPGTGGGSGSNDQIPFKAGSSSGQYTYQVASSSQRASLASLDGISQSPQGQVYPNADLTIAEESACSSSFGGQQPTVWTGEFGSQAGQHLHFLFFSRASSAYFNMVGNGTENWWGILYNPEPVSGNSNSGYTIKMDGTSGSSTGPPELTGQIITDTLWITGNATVEVYYRPCTATDFCTSGPGVGLVE